MNSTDLLSPWFVRRDDPAAASHVFCLPYAGAGASAFSGWPLRAGTAQICPVQFPGRENRLREQHYETFEHLADELAKALVPWLDRPFVFFGHCAGALQAYESVLRLAELGLPVPGRLVVSGQPAPHEAGKDWMLATSEPQLRTQLEFVMRLRGVKPRPDMVDLAMTVLLEDLAAAARYERLEPVKVACPITVVRWTGDPQVQVETLQEWRKYADEVTFTEVEGASHDFVRAPQEVLRVLDGSGS